MSKSAIEVIATYASLKAAWHHVSRGKLAGTAAFRIDLGGESFYSFERSLEANLKKISSDLLEDSYDFGSLQPFFVPKTNGKKRLICVPSISDRVVQRAILNYLTPKSERWLSNGISFGFVPNLGVPDAVKLAVHHRNKRPWVFKTDISAFFDRIDRKILIRSVSEKIKHRSLHRIIKSAIECEIYTADEAMSRKIRSLDIRAGRGVRQGMPLSPFFANLMLYPFDQACVEKNLAAVRYADDLIFFARSEKEAIDLQCFCLENLNALNLEIPALVEGSKTQIYKPEESADFLGVELRLNSAKKYEVAISNFQMNEIRNRILTFGNLKELKNRNLDISRFGNAMRAATSAYCATYDFCSNSTELNNNLQDWEQVSLIRIIKELGICVEKLNVDQRWFLCLK